MLTQQFKKCSLYLRPICLFMETLFRQKNWREYTAQAADPKNTENEGPNEGETEGQREGEGQ